MKTDPKKAAPQLLAVIATPALAESAAKIFKKNSLPLQYRFNAAGTASSDIMDVLGLGSIDKCMLISILPKHLSEVMLKKLHSDLRLDTVNSGIAFTISLTGASSLIFHMLAQSAGKNDRVAHRKDEDSMADTKYTLVAAIVNRGFSGDVMEAAKGAGARGGTVVHSRHIGMEEFAHLWGGDIHGEKEIVIILTEFEKKMPIMQSISDRCGINSDAKGFVVSMPIDSVMGI